MPPVFFLFSHIITGSGGYERRYCSRLLYRLYVIAAACTHRFPHRPAATAIRQPFANLVAVSHLYH